jgi:hypothetical protein
VNGGDEHIERTGGGLGHYTCASIQSNLVISVPLPARLTDTVVDSNIDLWIQLQTEDVGRGERVALLAPVLLPLATSLHRAPPILASHERTKADKWDLEDR